MARTVLSIRYILTGKIVVDTVLHVGSGRGDERTDATVVKNEGKPFIPGSSLKGAVRSAVERIISSIPEFTTCLLSSEMSNDRCLSVDEGLQGKLSEIVERRGPGSEDKLIGTKDYPICDTCQLFGSPYWASKVTFFDLPVTDPCPDNLPLRDGVAIDRDTGAAAPGAKFDFEVVPPKARFNFELLIENPTPKDLGLLAIGLQELQLGMIPLGGNTSRGPGKCHLELESIIEVDFSSKDKLLDYLLNSHPGNPHQIYGKKIAKNQKEAQKILKKWMEELFPQKKEERKDAQNSSK